MGSKNNLVSVKKSDFEVFQALAKDSEGLSNSVQTEYGQEIPVIKPWEKIPGPPILPPHLLQVILNKDTPLSVSTCIFMLSVLRKMKISIFNCSVNQRFCRSRIM